MWMDYLFKPEKIEHFLIKGKLDLEIIRIKPNYCRIRLV